MKNKKRDKKLLGRIKCHGNKNSCKTEHALQPKTPKGTKPIKKLKKIYVKTNK